MQAAHAARPLRLAGARPWRSAGGLIALLLLLALVAGVSSLASLRAAATHLESAADLTRAGRSAAARRALALAIVEADGANAAAELPLLGSLAAPLGLDDERAATAALSNAVRDSAALGLAATVALDASVGAVDAAGSIYRDGRIDPAGVEIVSEVASDASEHLERISAALRSTPRPSMEAFADRMAEAEARLASVAEATDRGRAALSVLPALAGIEGDRRYLLAFEAPAEARGGGGLVGLYGVLSATDGAFDLERVGSTRALTTRVRGPVPAPGWFERAYGQLGALDDARQANLSPTFPATSEVLLAMYEEAFGESLDGVIAMDPVVLGKLTRATGRLSAPGWGVELHADNARRLLMHDVYLRFGRWHSKEQNVYLSALVDELWARLRSDDVDATALIAALAGSAESGHLKIYARDPKAAAALADLGVDGDPGAAGPNVQMVFHNNWGANKVDYFLRRTIDSTVALQADGGATVTTRISLDNRAPSHPASLLTRAGLRSDLPVGANLMTLSALLPEGASDVGVTGAGRIRRVVENGLPSVWMHLGLAAGERSVVTLGYQIPGTAGPDGEAAFTLYPHASVRPDRYTIRFVPPPGGAIVPLERGRLQEDGSVTDAGVLKIPKTFRVALD